ncbi:hypothetical protein JMJ77_0013600 [Colletotrichum scovillei]|uniref:Uncharacterized protein n=1 Tax=Colletotrichum scovillei TaxID=1209932 RepID=A0A9P7U5U4_9PEZI|nr:hypothetical protein JMJ78_0012890 [Colletotrichum scovillei]KAG7040603.1 hypothetical protein JMJ77_0013600 [Colletotrichum scovillei]KAG7060650.1 hypothetical protein JMJ76_0006193 [Colletotrichum scovillei]
MSSPYSQSSSLPHDTTLTGCLEGLSAGMSSIPFADAFTYHLRHHLQVTEQNAIAFNSTLFQFSLSLMELQRTHQKMRDDEQKHAMAMRDCEEKHSQLAQDYGNLYLRFCRSLDNEERLQRQLMDLQREMDMKEDVINYLVQSAEGIERDIVSTEDTQRSASA